MRIRYVIRLEKPILLQDHWPIPLMGNGQLRVVSDGQVASALEVTFVGQPTSYSPDVQQDLTTNKAPTISTRDQLLPFVRVQLESAFAYLQCYFNVELRTGEIEAEYTAEVDAEKGQIPISRMKIARADRLLPMSYDFLTRAIMAAEKSEGPNFEAKLVMAARAAAMQQRYIDSFRYSFLLVEALYGEGKFKSAQLKDALKGNAEFVKIVRAAQNEPLRIRQPRGSDTEQLLSSSPSADALIDHLVEKRGFYFHGNKKHKDAWKPQDQAKAEALCGVALAITMLIAHSAAAPMFDDNLSKRHYDDAKRAGAIMAMNVDFVFRELDDAFDRKENLTINLPGTTVTPKMAQYVAQQFLARFEHGAPVAMLKSASCTVKATGQKVFDMNFYTIDPTTTS